MNALPIGAIGPTVLFDGASIFGAATGIVTRTLRVSAPACLAASYARTL